MRPTPIVHSNRTAVVWLNKHVSYWLSTFFNSIIIFMNLWANLTLWHMLTICYRFSSWLITSNLSSIMIVFSWLFTWIAQDDVDLHTYIILFNKKPMPLKGKHHHPHDYITNIISPHMTDGVTGTSFSGGLQHKTSTARDCLCQIT